MSKTTTEVRRKSYLKHRDKRLAAEKKRYAENKDNPAFKARLSAARKKYYLKNKERLLADHRKRYAADAVKYNNRVRAYQKANQAKVHAWSLATSRRAAGLPVPTRPMPVACESCNRARKLKLDHCHVTGKFRGWLCGPCNMGVGQLDDNLEGVMRMMAYLEKNG